MAHILSLPVSDAQENCDDDKGNSTGGGTDSDSDSEHEDPDSDLPCSNSIAMASLISNSIACASCWLRRAGCEEDHACVLRMSQRNFWLNSVEDSVVVY